MAWRGSGVFLQLLTDREQFTLDSNAYTAGLPHGAPDFALTFEQSPQFRLGFHDVHLPRFPG